MSKTALLLALLLAAACHETVAPKDCTVIPYGQSQFHPADSFAVKCRK